MTTMNPPADRLAPPPAPPVTKAPPSADADKMPKSAIVDDMAMIRAASELTRDLVTPSARIYWADFLASAFVGYAGVVAAILPPSTPWMLAAALVAALALYPAGRFLHATTPIHQQPLTGLRPTA